MNSPTVLFVCANENQVKILVPIAEQLAKVGWSAKFLSLDSYYDQKTGDELERQNCDWQELASVYCRGRWYEHWDLRHSYIMEAAVEVEQIFSRFQPSCVVLGHDIEGIEQLIVRCAERLAIPTVIVQDANQMNEPYDERKSHHYQQFPFDGGCDLLISWSEGRTKQLRTRGIMSEVVAAGNPRMDGMVDWRKSRTASPPYTALLAMQCFTRHLNMRPAQEVAIYERIIRQLLTRDDVIVKVKLHPQQLAEENFFAFEEVFGERVRVTNEGDSLDLLKEADLVVTISSTVAIESAGLGIPTIRLGHLLHTAQEVYQREDKKLQELLKKENFPEEVWFGLEEGFLENYLRPIDGQATNRAAEAISQLVERKDSPVSSAEPKVSVLIIAEEGELVGTVWSVLRTSSYPIEVLFIDTSADGSLISQVEQSISDPRLRCFARPRSGIGNALKFGISQSRGQYIARLGTSCIALPGWAESITKQLSNNDTARIALSWFFVRDERGIISQAHSLPRQQSLEEFAKNSLSPLALQGYVVRKSEVGHFSEESPSAEAELLQNTAGNFQDPNVLTIFPGVLFFTPFDSKIYAEKGPPPATKVEPVASADSSSESGKRASVICAGIDSLAKAERVLEQLKEQSIHSEDFETILTGVTVSPEEASAISQFVESKDRVLFFSGDTLGEARNKALKSSEGEILVFLGAEIVPDRDLLAEHLDAQQALDRAGAVLGGLKLAPNQDSGLLTRSLFENNYFYTYDETRDGGEYGFDKFLSANLSIARSLLTGLEKPFDERLKSEWGIDLDTGHQLWREGLRISFSSKPVAYFSRKLSLESLIEFEVQKKADLVRLIRKCPELTGFCLGVPSITETEIAGWKQAVEEDASAVPQVLRQIEELTQMVGSLQQAGNTTDLERNVAQVIEVLSEHIRRREFVRYHLQLPNLGAIQIGEQSY